MLCNWLGFTYVFRNSTSVFMIGRPDEFDYIVNFPRAARQIIKTEDEFLARFNKHLLWMTDSQVLQLRQATLEEGLLCIDEDEPAEILKRVARRIGTKFWAIELSNELFDYINEQYSIDAALDLERERNPDAKQSDVTEETAAVFDLEGFATVATEALKASFSGNGPLPSFADAFSALESEADRKAFFAKLGVGQKAKVKLSNGKLYVIITGRAGLRPLMPGIRFLASNPQVAELALTLPGQIKKLKSAIKLNILFTVPLEIVSTLLDDEREWKDLFGHLATAGLVTLATQLIMWGVGLAVGVVVGTSALVAGAMVVGALVIGALLAFAADYLGIPEKLNKALENIIFGLEKGWIRLKDKIDDPLKIKTDVPNRTFNLRLIEDSMIYNFFPDMMRYR